MSYVEDDSTIDDKKAGDLGKCFKEREQLFEKLFPTECAELKKIDYSKNANHTKIGTLGKLDFVNYATIPTFRRMLSCEHQYSLYNCKYSPKPVSV